MANAKFIMKARKPNPVVSQEDIDKANAGEAGAASYWKVAFQFGGTRYFKTKPRTSQCTQSEFFSAVYALQEEMEGAIASDQADLESLRDEWVGQAQEIGEECREKFDNMPEGLQQGDTGQLLEERADAMESWASELEGVDLEFEPEEDADQDALEEQHTEWVEEKLEELQNIEPGV